LNTGPWDYKADRVEALLRRHQAPVEIERGVVTPLWLRFHTMPMLGVSLSRIKGLSDELAALLDAPFCRVCRQGAGVLIEIPRSDPQTVRLIPLLKHLALVAAEDEDKRVPPVTATLGVEDDGAPLLIRFPSRKADVAHVLVAGETRSGKTSLLRTMAVSLAWWRSEWACSLLVAGRDLVDLEGVPGLTWPVLTEREEVVDALRNLVDGLDDRAACEAFTPLVILIDDGFDLDQTVVNTLIAPLVERGREAGVHLILATQAPSAVEGVSFPVRMVGKVRDAAAARAAAGVPGSGAEGLLGKGDFVVIAEGMMRRVQAAYIAPGEVEGVVDAIRAEEER
jgi:S-DNA-T family DNA segregation ATPase FtsK/SpoIIIE